MCPTSQPLKITAGAAEIRRPQLFSNRSHIREQGERIGPGDRRESDQIEGFMCG
jgi:hypothetical protein